MATKSLSGWLTGATAALGSARPARRATRRWLVLAFLLSFPVVVVWFWPGFVLGLGLRFALMREALRLGDSAPALIDERQEAVRNRVYHLAYYILSALSVVAVLLVALVVSVVTVPGGHAWLARTAWLLPGLGVVVLQLVGGLPPAILLWTQPDEPDEEEGL